MSVEPTGFEPLGEEPTTNPGATVNVSYLRAKLHEEFKAKGRRDWFRDILIAVGAVGASVVAGILFVDNRVQAQTDAGVRVHESRIVALEQQQAQVRTDVHEVQLDIRELYKVVQTGRRSSRLEQPVPMQDSGR